MNYPYLLRVEFTYTPYATLDEMYTCAQQARNSGQSVETFVSIAEAQRRELELIADVELAHIRATAEKASPTKTALQEAQEIIYGDREKTYGHPAKNLQRIADLWTQYLVPHIEHQENLSAQDVAQMMILLKIARLQNQPDHRDSRVDVVGYAALVDRLHERN